MIRTIFGIAIMIVITVSLVVYSSIKNIGETSKVVIHTYETIDNLNSLNLTIVQFESATRGFLLSDKDNYPNSSVYNQQILSKLDQLKKLTFSSPQQTQKLLKLSPIVLKRVQILNQLIDLKNRNSFNASKDIDKVLSGSGLMQQIDKLIDDIKEMEKELLEERRQTELSYSKSSFSLFLLGLILSILLLSTAFYLIRRELKIRRKAENQLEAILDHSMTLIFLKDLEGRYIIVNRRFEELFNTTNKKVKGKTAYDLFSKEVADSVTRHDSIVLSSKSPIQFDETSFIGDIKRNFISIRFPLLDVDGNIYAICGMSTEITERQKKEDEIKELNIAMAHNIAELQIVNKEIEAFSYSIS
ncbi:PAS domain S-box protein, partial [bacterium]